jgi:hypothetical protein
LLSGLPNLAARFEHVESRVWSEADKASYLAAVADADAALEESLDPHIMEILKGVPSLQDYRLLAVPMADETAPAGSYGGITLGQPPTLSLTEMLAAQTVTLTATLSDPTDGEAGLARPLAVDWGDGRVTRHEFPAGQATLDVAHDYAAPSRYAIYAVAANNSGLRGAACSVVEVPDPGQGAEDESVVPPTLVRAGLAGLTVQNLQFTKDIRLALDFVDASGQRFRAGRSRIGTGPTNITVSVELGDAYAHNPSRVDIAKLVLEPKHDIPLPTGRRPRITKITLSTLLLGVFSTAQMRTVEVARSLSVEMLEVYTEGATSPLPGDVVTANTDGTITVPLMHEEPTTATWQPIERIEIAITPDMFDDLILDATPTPLAAGTTAAWAELRPGRFSVLTEAPPIPPEQSEPGAA